MGKIQKKVQKIANQLQKVEKPKDPPAGPEVHSVEPMSKGKPGAYGIEKRFHRKDKGKKKKEIVKGEKDGSIERYENKKEPEEEGFTGYAGLARRVARGLERVGKGVKFWFED